MESSAPSLGSALVSLRASWHPRCRPLARPEHENRPGPPQFRKRGRTRQAPGGFRSALVKPGKTSQLQLSARWAGTGISAFGRYDARWRVRALPVLGGAIRRLSVKRSAGPARSKAPAHVRPSCFSSRERLQPATNVAEGQACMCCDTCGIASHTIHRDLLGQRSGSGAAHLGTYPALDMCLYACELVTCKASVL